MENGILLNIRAIREIRGSNLHLLSAYMAAII